MFDNNLKNVLLILLFVRFVRYEHQNVHKIIYFLKNIFFSCILEQSISSDINVIYYVQVLSLIFSLQIFPVQSTCTQEVYSYILVKDK